MGAMRTERAARRSEFIVIVSIIITTIIIIITIISINIIIINYQLPP